MKFCSEALNQVALAARIEIAGEEEMYAKYLEQMTGRLVGLVEMNLESVTPTGRIAPQANMFRDDRVEKKFPEEMNLKNAPAVRDGYFRVPRII